MTTAGPSWLVGLQSLKACLDEERLLDAVEECSSLLSQHPSYNDKDSVQDVLPAEIEAILHDIWAKCELHLGHFDQLISSSSSSTGANKGRNTPQDLQAYAHYRLHQYTLAKNMATPLVKESALARHVVSQSLYRLHEYQDPRQVTNVNDDDDKLNTDFQMQLWTNALAICIAQATPYCQNDSGDYTSVLNEIPESLLELESAYDLLFNLATYRILTGSMTGVTMLEQARQSCIQATTLDDGSDEDAQQSELAPIQYHLHHWSRLWKGLPPIGDDTSQWKNVPAAVQAVRNVNTSSKSFPDELDTTWTALQQRIYYYNRAVWHLQAKQYKVCLESCAAVVSLGKPNKKQPTSTAKNGGSKDNLAWWKARVSVLQAHCHAQQASPTTNGNEKAIQLLQEQIQTLSPNGISQPQSTTVRDHALAHVQLHLAYFQGKTQHPQDMVQVLTSLPESIQSQKAVIATLATLYQELGQMDQVSSLLQTDSGGAADFYLAQGEYEKAAALYEQTGDRVKWVLALSYFDPIKAQSVWEEEFENINTPDQPGWILEELDGTALEERELPRKSLQSRHSKASATVSASVELETKRSHAAVLKRRARKKEAYLKDLEQQGKFHPDRPTVPDPERWTPKFERAAFKRRRNRNFNPSNNKSAQGGISEKDAAKLDVAARKSGVESSSGAPSTAHMGVAGSQKRGVAGGGRRR